MKLVAVTGRAGAGKDTLGDYLVREYNFRKYNFAEPIKRALNSMFGWNMMQWDDRDWKEAVIPELGKSPRQLAQTLGTEWGRELVSPDVWVYCAKLQWQAHCALARSLGEEPRFVLCDLRFDNEAAWVLAEGGVIVECRRDVAAIAAHKSENGIRSSTPRFIVDNSGDIGSYLKQAAALLGVGSAR